MSQYFLGIDIGNTKSHALICDERGAILALGQGGQGNHEVVGRDGLEAILHAIVHDALKQAGLHIGQLCGAGLGIAGFDWETDRPLHNEVIATLRLNAPYILVNDCMLGLVAGARQGWGVVVNAGTSSNARGRDLYGREGRITGNGAWFGEYGGGIELVYRGLDAVSRAWSLRGPQTSLSQIYVEATGAADVEDMLEGLARGRYTLSAALAPAVFDAAAAGDRVASEALHWISKELANLAIGIIRQLHFEALEFDLVLSGSLYKGSPLIREMLLGHVRHVAPDVVGVHLAAPPVVGGVFLGMESAHVDFVPLRSQVIAGAYRFIQQQEV
jgi:N-acetylglucosamine kinase-like BadF-type ATPase